MSTQVLELTDRQKREQEYYDTYASSFDLNQTVDLSPVQSKERRPWNSYWAVYHFASDVYKPEARLLDFGSGPGDNAFRFAKIGYSVEGFDISPTNVHVSQAVFARNNMEAKATFKVSPAETLPYADNSFDVIAGIDILHHVDIATSIRECQRVLKPQGNAIFREPLEVPVLDYIRNLSIVKMFAPKEKSFELHITEDERKLNQQDLATIKSIFPDARFERSFLFARFDKFFRQGSDPKPSVLEKIDFLLLRLFPFLRSFGGVVMITLKK